MLSSPISLGFLHLVILCSISRDRVWLVPSCNSPILVAANVLNPQEVFILQVRCLWPGLPQDQHARFSLRKFLKFFSSIVLA